MLRQAVAEEAARVMAEQGIDDFLFAKRKAAARLGVVDAAILPRNTEIEAALFARRRLFADDRHQDEIADLRRSALQAMRLMAEFDPRLVGPVLTGTASAHSDIHLHLFSESAEAVSMRLEERGVPHETLERRLRFERDRTVTFPAFRFVAGNQTIDAVVFPLDGIRQSPSQPGRWQADAARDRDRGRSAGVMRAAVRLLRRRGQARLPTWKGRHAPESGTAVRQRLSSFAGKPANVARRTQVTSVGTGSTACGTQRRSDQADFSSCAVVGRCSRRTSTGLWTRSLGTSCTMQAVVSVENSVRIRLRNGAAATTISCSYSFLRLSWSSLVAISFANFTASRRRGSFSPSMA